MKFQITNSTGAPLTLTMELLGEQHHVPAGSKAIVTLDDGELNTLEFCPENRFVLWGLAEVEIVPTQRQPVET